MTPEHLLPNGVIGHNQNNNITLGEKKSKKNHTVSLIQSLDMWGN